MRINEFRHGVNVGARIEQSRVGYNLRKQGRERLTDYIKEMYEEVIAMAANGARGVGLEESSTSTTYWTGYPNAFRAPGRRALLHAARPAPREEHARRRRQARPGRRSTRCARRPRRCSAARRQRREDEPVRKAGKKMFLLACDARGHAGHPQRQRRARLVRGAEGAHRAIGKEAEVFKGGAGMFNGVLVDEMERA
jgi:hypothetical protein